jgi:hypothetical protein
VKRDIQRYEIAQVPGAITDFRSYAMNLLEFGVLTKRNPGQEVGTPTVAWNAFRFLTTTHIPPL